MKIIAVSLALLLNLLAAANSRADVLLIDVLRAADGRNLPCNGLTTAKVRDRWGEPGAIHAAVGQPPISRWDYPEFSVYFEYDLALCSVLNESAALEPAPVLDIQQ